MDERPPEKVRQPEQIRQPDRSLVVIAEVTPLDGERPTPTGLVTFSLDGIPMNRPTLLDARGRARATIARLKPGEHTIRATYSGGGRYEYHSSSSPNLLHTVAEEKRPDRPSKKGRRTAAD